MFTVMTWQSLGIWGLEGLQKFFYATLTVWQKRGFVFTRRKSIRTTWKQFLSAFFSDCPQCGGVTGISKTKVSHIYFYMGLSILIFIMRIWHQSVYEFCLFFFLLWAEVEQVVSRTCCDHNFSRSTFGWLQTNVFLKVESFLFLKLRILENKQQGEDPATHPCLTGRVRQAFTKYGCSWDISHKTRWAIHLLFKRHVLHHFLEAIIWPIHEVNFRFALASLQM